MLLLCAFCFTGDEAKAESRNFETLYFAAVTASMELAKLEGPYSTFEGSPISGRISA
jgi:ribonucleoside-diphosphate reductase alpha chain